jgi:hypothetical protein
MRAGDVRLGSVIEHEGMEWAVWGPGPVSGEYWIVRYEGSETVTKAVRAAQMTSLMERSRRGR